MEIRIHKKAELVVEATIPNLDLSNEDKVLDIAESLCVLLDVDEALLEEVVTLVAEDDDCIIQYNIEYHMQKGIIFTQM